MKKERDLTELKTIVRRGLAAVQHDIKLFYDWGNYKSRKTHRLSDVEYQTQLNVASVNLCNAIIDNLVASFVMSSNPLVNGLWTSTRDKLMELLEVDFKAEYEAQNPRPDNENTGPIEK